MSVNTVKEVRIKNAGGTYDIQPVGAEGQYVDISRDANGNIIEDITASGVVVDSTEGLAETLKNIEESIASSNEFSEMTDVDFTSLADKNLVQYDSTAAKWKNVAMDSTPTANSNKPVTSGGIKTELDKKLNDYTNGASAWDTTPTASSNKPVTSDGIKTALDLKTNDADLKAVAKSGDASDVDYTNTTSGLAATKVQDAIDEVAAKNQTLTNQVKDMNNVYGSKNLLPNNATTQTINGITFTVNSNGSITISGTATGSANLEISDITPSLAGTSLIMSDESTSTAVYMFISYILNGSTQYITDKTFTIPNNSTDIKVYIHVNSNYSDNVTVYPMIRLASIKDDTYEPYAKTNQQLTQDTTALLDNTEVNGAVNYIYPIDSTKTDSAGVTWTLNSDNSISVSSGGIAPSTGTGFSYRNNNAAFLRGKTVTFKANVTGNTPTYDKLYFAVICRETEQGANLVRHDVWPVTGQTEVTFTVPNNTNYIVIGCNIQNGATTAIDCKISPIVSLASYNGPYVPYAKTNRELTGYADNTEVNGAVNMLPNNATSQVKYGVTFTVNDDGSVTANGTATNNTNTFTTFTLPAGNYILSGCPSDGSGNKYRIAINNRDTSTNLGFDYGSGFEFTLNEETNLIVYFDIRSGYTANNLTFKPMITVPSYNGPYVPYAKSNKELTEDVDSMYSELLDRGFLGSPGQSKVIDNINNFRLNGFFRTKIDNVDHYGIAMCFNADWVLQIATQTRGTDIKFRIYNNGAWTSWKTISTVSNS